MTRPARKILCLGNSHIAALRSAWDDNPNRWPELDVRFIGAHKGLLLDTTVTNGWLRPTSPDAIDAFARLGGNRGARLADYDAIVLSGCMIALALSASIYRRLHWAGLPSVAKHLDLANAPQLLTSRAAAISAMHDSLSQRLGVRLIKHLRAHIDLPIYLTSQPRASAAVLRHNDPTTKSHRIAHLNGDARLLSAAHESAAILAIQNAGGTYIPQPPQTIAHYITTDDSFMRGATRLAAKPGLPQPPQDVRHANTAYGALVLDQIAKRT